MVVPATPSPDPTQVPSDGIGVVGGSGGSGGAGGAGGAGNGPNDPELAGSGGGAGLGLWVTAGLVGALGLIFVFFRRRRREDDLVEAASPGGPAPAMALAAVGGSLAATPPPPVPTRRTPVLPDTPDDEANIPRWRRPSVQSARKANVRNVEIAHVPVAFKDGAKDVERRRIRYRLVRVSSIPDEIMGEEVARLDRGDEVELIRAAGSYWLVRTPYGDEGWVHSMTLESGPPEPDDDAPLEEPTDDDSPPF